MIIARGEAVRSFTLRPGLVAGVGGVLLLLLLSYIAATVYLVLRDDLIAASDAHELELRQGYEDRITELRSQMDRVSSRQMLNQDAVDGKMQRLLSRQAALSVRQSQLVELKVAADRAGTDGAVSSKTAAKGLASIDSITTGSIDRNATLDGVPLRGANAEEKLAAVERSLDAMERDQASLVARLTDRVSEKITQINSVLGGIGRKVDMKSGKNIAVGGPFVAKPPESKLTAFGDRLAFATGRVEQLSVLRNAARKLPLSKPLPTLAISSSFGSRTDPFLGTQGYHTGVDFMSEQGLPVFATAPGIVTEADYNGGYGNMVDISHGNGLVTRYGHLSKILVRDGQKIEIGTKIGLVGSTGRSTGPHLHYEVRVDGDAIDPMPFIRAGTELRGVL